MTAEEQLEILTAGAANVVVAEELLSKLKEGRALRVKYGADPSAPDLHLGHSVPLRRLKQFQELGHQVIFIIGDYTGRIGDPSGRTKTRPMLSDEEIKHNATTYVAQVGKILDVQQAEIVYNSQWFGEMNAADLLALASHYTVARMLERDDFALRVREGIPISVIEMLYPLIQAYDSVAVKADVEIGGTDQLFNLLVGRDIMRAYGLTPQIVMTWPLLVGTDGQQKMSKSLGNYIGIAEPPGEMFGKLMSIPDELMPQYYELLLEKTHAEVEQLQQAIETGQLHPRQAQANLAEAVVTMYHSTAAAAEARAEFDSVFAEGKLPTEMPELVLGPQDLAAGKIWIVKLIVTAGCAETNAQARRLIRQGAVRLNDEVITDESAEVEVNTGDILRVGKRHFAQLIIGQ